MDFSDQAQDGEAGDEHRDERGTEDPGSGGHGGDPEPKPGEDPGPMGNPAEDEEALRKQQEDSSE
jgi:hypothetical protein